MTETQKLREALQAITNIDDATSHTADASAALDRIGQIARQALALPTAEQVDDINVAESFTSVTKTAEPVGERANRCPTSGETVVRNGRRHAGGTQMTENQKLREALLSDMDIAVLRMPVHLAFAGNMAQFQYHNRVQALLARIEALALPTADHLPEARKMVVDHFPDATKMIETAAPVGEREAFEREMSKPPFEFCMDRWPDDGSYAWPGNYAAYHTQCAWAAWQARAALSAGDAVLAEREACAKLCEEVADDLITAMRKEGETDDEVMTSLVASARVCAEEIRGGYSKKFNPHNAAIDAAMRKDKL